jgi:hypothetical protein
MIHYDRRGSCSDYISGADPGFQVRGEDALKKIAPSGGRRGNCWGISCEKSRFYAKKSPLNPPLYLIIMKINQIKGAKSRLL